MEPEFNDDWITNYKPTQEDWDNWQKSENELIERRKYCRMIGMADKANNLPHSHSNLPVYAWHGNTVLKWYSEAYDGGYKGETGQPPEEFLRVEETLKNMETFSISC